MNDSAPARSSLALRRIALFEGLGDACLDRIAADCDWRMLEARRPLFTRASGGGEVYFLASGRARITTYSANGREVAFRDCDAGAHFGDLSALDGQPRSADVVTLEPSLLACMPPQAFLALLERLGEVVRPLLLGRRTLDPPWPRNGVSQPGGPSL